METVHLDTHIVAWLHQGNTDALSARAADLLATSRLLISPIVTLELTYIHEIGRIKYTPDQIIKQLKHDINLELAEHESFSEIMKLAREISWTRDAFDRIIVAHAHVCNAFLITKDRIIRQHYKKAIW